MKKNTKSAFVLDKKITKVIGKVTNKDFTNTISSKRRFKSKLFPGLPLGRIKGSLTRFALHLQNKAISVNVIHRNLTITVN